MLLKKTSLSIINEKGILNYIYHPKLKKKRDREKKEGRGYPTKVKEKKRWRKEKRKRISDHKSKRPCSRIVRHKAMMITKSNLYII